MTFTELRVTEPAVSLYILGHHKSHAFPFALSKYRHPKPCYPLAQGRQSVLIPLQSVSGIPNQDHKRPSQFCLHPTGIPSPVVLHCWEAERVHSACSFSHVANMHLFALPP